MHPTNIKRFKRRGTVCLGGGGFDDDKHYTVDQSACFVKEFKRSCFLPVLRHLIATHWGGGGGGKQSKAGGVLSKTRVARVLYIAHAPLYRLHFIQKINKFADLFYGTLLTVYTRIIYQQRTLQEYIN
jgi:hypothetical protein